MAYLYHAYKLEHRNVKPTNILLSMPQGFLNNFLQIVNL